MQCDSSFQSVVPDRLGGMSMNQPTQSNPFASPVDSRPDEPLSEYPKTYLSLAITSLLFCGWVFAFPAVFFATSVQRRFNMGDIEGANWASRNAKRWGIIAIVLGVITIVVGLLVGLAFYGYFATEEAGAAAK